MSLEARWQAAARLVGQHRDVLDERPGDADADSSWPRADAGPSGLVARGWASFLLAIDDASLAEFEIHGHDATWPSSTPESLVAFASAARAVCAIPELALPSGSIRPLKRGEKARKRAQVDAFARLVVPLAANATRVVDVGSGHGHLTREIAQRIALPVVGFERDTKVAGRARELSAALPVEFATRDVLADGLEVSAGDCVIGLHACGELGDAMVESVARSGASLALVGCCLQKRRAASRPALSRGTTLLDLPKAVLGLSNLTARDEGVEATRAENLAARERRIALHRLLADRLGGLRQGAEIDGLNRRAAHRDLGSLVARAFAIRGLEAPNAAVINDAAGWASAQHARARRLQLPRSMLARALEVFVLLDRGRYLEEHGLAVTVGVVFPPSVSARNLALVATRRA